MLRVINPSSGLRHRFRITAVLLNTEIQIVRNGYYMSFEVYVILLHLSIKLKLVNENRLGIVAVELHPEQQCI
jgi:hypothetical protein